MTDEPLIGGHCDWKGTQFPYYTIRVPVWESGTQALLIRAAGGTLNLGVTTFLSCIICAHAMSQLLYRGGWMSGLKPKISAKKGTSHFRQNGVLIHL